MSLLRIKFEKERAKKFVVKKGHEKERLLLVRKSDNSKKKNKF